MQTLSSAPKSLDPLPVLSGYRPKINFCKEKKPGDSRMSNANVKLKLLRCYPGRCSRMNAISLIVRASSTSRNGWMSYHVSSIQEDFSLLHYLGTGVVSTDIKHDTATIITTALHNTG